MGRADRRRPPRIRGRGPGAAYGLELEPEVVEAIVASPSVFRLRSLDLSGGTLDDRGARVLAGAAGRIAHLEIDLSWNHLSSDGRRRIADALPFAKVGPVYESRRRGSRGVRLPTFYMRYMATVE